LGVATVLVAAGAAVASLVGLVPYEFFRWRWEVSDRAARERIVRATLPMWTSFTFAPREKGPRRTVYRIGEGPPVLVLHEFPGLSTAVVAFAQEVAERGFSVYAPVLCGNVQQPSSPARDVLLGFQ
jgi:hypothetical protein